MRSGERIGAVAREDLGHVREPGGEAAELVEMGRRPRARVEVAGSDPVHRQHEVFHRVEDVALQAAAHQRGERDRRDAHRGLDREQHTERVGGHPLGMVPPLGRLLHERDLDAPVHVEELPAPVEHDHHVARREPGAFGDVAVGPLLLPGALRDAELHVPGAERPVAGEGTVERRRRPLEGCLAGGVRAQEVPVARRQIAADRAFLVEHRLVRDAQAPDRRGPVPGRVVGPPVDAGPDADREHEDGDAGHAEHEEGATEPLGQRRAASRRADHSCSSSTHWACRAPRHDVALVRRAASAPERRVSGVEFGAQHRDRPATDRDPFAAYAVEAGVQEAAAGRRLVGPQLGPSRSAQCTARTQCAEPVTGSSGIPTFGPNTRETMSIPPSGSPGAVTITARASTAFSASKSGARPRTVAASSTSTST